MKTTQENKYNMFLSLKSFFLSKMAAFSLLPHFDDYFTIFTNCLEAIQALSEKRTLIETGAMKIKPAIREQLIVLISDAAKRVYAYAVFIENERLASQALFIKKEVKKATDSKLTDYGNAIYNMAQDFLTELTIYKVTEATQLELLNTIEDFTDANPSVKNVRTESKSITSDFNVEFKKAEKTIANIGLLVDTIDRTNPALYESYQNAIKVYNYGTRSFDILGQVDHFDNNEGMKGVTVTVTLQGSDVVVLKKKSAAKGGFRGKIPADGVYIFKFQKMGFIEETRIVAIVKGEHCIIKVKLIPEDYTIRA